MTRAMAVVPETLNVEKRTVEIIFTTGARVKRGGFFTEPYIEELSLDQGAIRMNRLENGAPFLDNHGFTDKAGVRSVLGVVQSATLIPGKEGRAVIKFSKRAEVADIFQDVQDGILRNVSVGYKIHKMERAGEIDGVPILRAVDWEPAEISLVPVGADSGARVRAENAEMTECEIEETRNDEPVETSTSEKVVAENEKTIETEIETKREFTEMTEAELKAMQEKAAKEARATEKARVTEIRALVAKTGLESELAEKYISEDKSVDDVRTLVIDELAARKNKKETETVSVSVEVGADNARAHRVEGMTDAILHRAKPSEHKVTDKARAFAYMSLLDMARACLEANRIDTRGKPRDWIADQALKMRALHSTSDFPEILANVAGKSLRAGYAAAPKTWGPFTREVSVADFKQISRVNLGDAPKLEKVLEGGEVKRGSISEAAEKYNVEEYAKIVGVTRKVIVNDDLNAFTQLPERMGRRAADLEADIVWAIIKANAAMADTYALFSSQHGNLGTPGVPSETTLAEARKLMRKQTGLDGAEINLSPLWIASGPTLETTIEKLLASVIPNASSGVNPFSASGRTPLKQIVEPRLETGSGASTTAYFLFSDLAQVDMVELARLEGRDGPALETRDGFDVAGVELKISHDVGAKAIDWRGMVKNAG